MYFSSFFSLVLTCPSLAPLCIMSLFFGRTWSFCYTYLVRHILCLLLCLFIGALGSIQRFLDAISHDACAFFCTLNMKLNDWNKKKKKHVICTILRSLYNSIFWKFTSTSCVATALHRAKSLCTFGFICGFRITTYPSLRKCQAKTRQPHPLFPLMI
jgi:hypothetical protein